MLVKTCKTPDIINNSFIGILPCMVCPSLQQRVCHLRTPRSPRAGQGPQVTSSLPIHRERLLLLEPGRCGAPSPVPRDQVTPHRYARRRPGDVFSLGKEELAACWPPRARREPRRFRSRYSPVTQMDSSMVLRRAAPPLCSAGCLLHGGLPTAGRGASARRRGMCLPRYVRGSG